MADLFRVIAPQVPVSTDVPMSLVDLAEESTGTSVLRVYRIWHIDGFQAAVTGAIALFTIARTRPGNERGNLVIEPAKKGTVLPAGINAGCRRSPEHGAVFRQYARDTNEFLPNTDAINNWEFDVPMALVWEAGYCDTNVQPLTVRPGEGVQVRQETSSSNLQLVVDFEIEFTAGST